MNNSNLIFRYSELKNVFEILKLEAQAAEYDMMYALLDILSYQEYVQKGFAQNSDERKLMYYATEGNTEKFFELFFKTYNYMSTPTKDYKGVWVESGLISGANPYKYTYDIIDENGSIIKSVTIQDTDTIAAIVEALKKTNGRRRAEGIIEESGMKDVLIEIFKNAFLGISQKTAFFNIYHTPLKYDKDYIISINRFDREEPFHLNPNIMIRQYIENKLDIEIKSNLNNFHIASARHGINVTDVFNYLSPDRGDIKDVKATVYDYLILKFLQLKFEEAFPIFVSASNSKPRVLLSSTIIDQWEKKLYLLPNRKNSKLFPSAQQIFAELSILKQVDPSNQDNMGIAGRNVIQDMQSIQKKVIQHASQKTAISCELWYGR